MVVMYYLCYFLLKKMNIHGQYVKLIKNTKLTEIRNMSVCCDEEKQVRHTTVEERRAILRDVLDHAESKFDGTEYEFSQRECTYHSVTIRYNDHGHTHSGLVLNNGNSGNNIEIIFDVAEQRLAVYRKTVVLDYD